MCAGYIGEKGDVLCADCWKSLPRTEQAILRQNETEATLAAPVERAAAYLFYEKEHPVQQLVHKMKYLKRLPI